MLTMTTKTCKCHKNVTSFATETHRMHYTSSTAVSRWLLIYVRCFLHSFRTETLRRSASGLSTDHMPLMSFSPTVTALKKTHNTYFNRRKINLRSCHVLIHHRTHQERRDAHCTTLDSEWLLWTLTSWLPWNTLDTFYIHNWDVSWFRTTNWSNHANSSIWDISHVIMVTSIQLVDLDA